MSKKIKIVADSTCDISPELTKKYNIEIHPFVVNLGEKSFRDGVDISTDDILKYYRETGNVSKTAAAPPGEYEELFRKWPSDEYDVLFFTISKGFSSAYANACIAAESFDNIYVVESANLSTGILLVVLAAADMVESGLSAKEIAGKLKDIVPKVRTSFVIDTLEFLWKGGRCSGVAALGANLLKLKPCIEVIDGKMTSSKKFRGNIDKVILQYVDERLRDRKDIIMKRIFITHTKCNPETVRAVRRKIDELMPGFAEVLETTAGCTVTSHCGPQTLGVLFIREG